MSSHERLVKTDRRNELIEIADRMGREGFAPRASSHDDDASFPFENYADLRDNGFLGLCIPESCGGLGADFESYCMIAAKIGEHCGATALTFNMHSISMLWSGIVCDDLDLDRTERHEHEERRAHWFAKVLKDQVLFAQPFSEPSGDAFTTRARRVDGGWHVSGKKHFASLSGAADYYAMTCTEISDAENSEGKILFLIVPKDEEGFRITGTWNPLGMRATVSRNLELRDVFVPDRNQLMPGGAFIQAARRWPHAYLSINPAYMGIARAAFDFTVDYLRGEAPGATGPARRAQPSKQFAVAQMRLKLDQAEALWRAALAEARVDPSREERLRMYSSHYTVMEHCNEICQLAIRTCGGRSIMKSMPLERLYRDSRCGSLMLPYTADTCLERLGVEALYRSGERD